MFHIGKQKPGAAREGKEKIGPAGTPDGKVPQDEPGTKKEERRCICTETLRSILSASQDIVFSEISVGGRHITTVFVDGLGNSKIVDDDVLKPLVQEDAFKQARSEQELVDLMMLGNVYHCQRKLRRGLDDCIGDLLTGSVALVFDEARAAVTFELKGFEKRSIAEPTNENVLKGSKECFIEVLRINTALIRRRIATRDLVVSQLKVGVRTSTSLAVVHLRAWPTAASWKRWKTA
jgi:spore germination protein KA